MAADRAGSVDYRAGARCGLWSTACGQQLVVNNIAPGRRSGSISRQENLYPDWPDILCCDFAFLVE